VSVGTEAWPQRLWQWVAGSYASFSLQGSVLLLQISWHAVTTANSIGLRKYK